jgi:hypothetical protein
MAAGSPSSKAGLRLSLRLRKLIGAVWLAGIVAVLPAWLVLESAVGRTSANLPEAPLPPGDRELILLELLRPVAGALSVAVAVAAATLLAWSIAWHAGTVRWWGGAGAARVRLAEILGHGVVWWWRYARLWCTGLLAAGSVIAALWVGTGALMAAVESSGIAFALLATAVPLSAAIGLFCWLATLRGAWLLGAPGRRSAVAAWLRGAGATAATPIRSTVPLVVWGVPALVLLWLPLLIDPPFALPALLLTWAGAAWCRVALFLSYAPQEPPEEWVRKMQARAAARAARPREQQPGYTTQRFPTRQS